MGQSELNFQGKTPKNQKFLPKPLKIKFEKMRLLNEISKKKLLKKPKFSHFFRFNESSSFV